MIDKVLVKERFRRSLATYEEEAIAQFQMNKKLCKYLEKENVKNKLHVLEIGCGTGILTRQLMHSFNIAELYLNDIVKEVIDPVKKKISFKNINFRIGDAENIEFPKNMDMIISGSTFQWFKNLPGMFHKIHNSLKPDGILIFSTFGLRNLIELREIFGKGLEYYTVSGLKQIASKYFEIVNIEEELLPLYFSDATSVIQHIRKTGVNAIQSMTWSKSCYKSFLDGYENFKTKRGYPLTYNPIYFIGKKK